jgi:hypothetical protein
LGCGYDLSFRDGENGQLLAYCFGGCEYNTIMMALDEYGAFDGADSTGSVYAGNGSVPQHRDDAARIARACEIYSLGVADERTRVYPLARHHNLVAGASVQ